MYPDIPYETNSQAEINLFYLLKKQLSNDFFIIHSFSWLSTFISKCGYTDEKEIDFLILHKNYGILVLEVKGGSIKYTKYSYLSNNQLIQNPEKQVKGNMHALRDLIYREIHKKYTFGHAVSFPDIIFPKDNIPTALRIFNNPHCTNLVIDKDDILSLQNRVIEIMQYWKKKFNKYHSESNFNSIIEFLVNINQTKPTLNDKIQYDHKQWLYLSSQQNKYLKFLIEKKLMYISGRAGTGKTVLAIILSRYLNNEMNKKVLFLTFNSLISNRIKIDVDPNTDAMTFHSFLHNNTPKSIDTINDSDKALEYIIDNIHNEYDSLIIDEAQSLKIRWLIKLKNHFINSNKDVYLFADTIQSLSGEENNTDESIIKDLSIEKKYVLTKNYRAPEKIHHRLNEFFESNIELSSVREESTKDLFEVFDDDPKNKIIKALSYLETENVDLINVALLISGRASGIESLKNDFYTKYPNLTIETINKYRGMEKPIVIIVLTFENDLNELYVAYSRATTQAIVIIYEPLIYSMPDFANILLNSSTTSKATKKSIQTNLKILKENYFSYVNKINHSPSSFQLYTNDNFWVIDCEETLSVESRILIMYLNSHNEKIIVFENSILEKTKLFHYKDNKESESLKYHFLKYRYCQECKKFTYNDKVFDEYYCNSCTESEKINKNIFKDSKKNEGKKDMLRLISLYKQITNRMEDIQRLSFLNEISSKYSLIAYIELLNILINEFKFNDKVELNYLRAHSDLNNNHYLKHKWTTYCQVITSKLISYKILEKERQGIYILKI